MAKPATKRRPANAPAAFDLDAKLEGVAAMNVEQLRDLWRQQRGEEPPPALSKDLIARALAYWLQEEVLGSLQPRLRRLLDAFTTGGPPPRHVKVGSVIVREYQGELHEVLVVPDGFCWRGEVYASLSTIARKITGTSWNGPRFFGLRGGAETPTADAAAPARAAEAEVRPAIRVDQGPALRQTAWRRRMKPAVPKPQRCAIYTRKSTEHNLDLAFNSLDAQREACEAYIKSQAHEGWTLIRDKFDDGGLSGASLERPALQALLDEVRSKRIDIIVVYKVDRLTRSLADFAKLVELFDAHDVSFVSVTQSFNTTSSMGRLTLNVLLSFAQFEREVIGERVRDKIAASKRKGIWVGGPVPLGYRSVGKKLRGRSRGRRAGPQNLRRLSAPRVDRRAGRRARTGRRQTKAKGPCKWNCDRRGALHGRPAGPPSEEPVLRRRGRL